eukprot:5208100-Pleurochrysis_carterae.AAC.4
MEIGSPQRVRCKEEVDGYRDGQSKRARAEGVPAPALAGGDACSERARESARAHRSARVGKRAHAACARQKRCTGAAPAKHWPGRTECV